jgi:Uma2 family endonuclease
MAVVQRTSADALVEKPPVTFAHGSAVRALTRSLIAQLDPAVYELDVNHSRVRRPTASYFIPDLAVLPVSLIAAFRGREGALEVYEAPLPLVVEVWSPSTGDYDIDTKLPAYRARGDEEIWRLHPFERTLTVWRRRDDGGYDEAVYHGGTVEVTSLPGVVVDLDALFGR